ncbi:hypothetical protein ACFQY7_45120 [Actinomadura luteofluorescens]
MRVATEAPMLGPSTSASVTPPPCQATAPIAAPVSSTTPGSAAGSGSRCR